MNKKTYRVRFKQNVKETIRYYTGPSSNNWVDVDNMSYCYRFLKPAYFIVEDDGELDPEDWRILEPSNMQGMFIQKKHTEPYIPVDLTIGEW